MSAAAGKLPDVPFLSWRLMCAPWGVPGGRRVVEHSSLHGDQNPQGVVSWLCF